MTPVQRSAWFGRAVFSDAVLVSTLLCLAAYNIGGSLPLIIGGGIGVYAGLTVGWWLHTWSDRRGPK